MYALDWLNDRARLFPDDEAIVEAKTGQSWTFRQINKRAEHLAAFLQAQHITKGDRVALLSPNHISYFDFLFACTKIGAVFVPMNWRLSEQELQYILRDASPKVVAVHEQFSEMSVHMAKEYSVLLLSGNDYLSKMTEYPQELRVPTREEHEPLAMIYTGGTTGKPKGAVLSHRSILWNAINTIISWNIVKEDRTLTCLPMFHTGGLNALSLPVLLMGGTVIISEKFDPDQAARDLQRYRCTIVLFVPTMHHLLVQTPFFQQAEYPDMKVFLSGGAPCPLAIYKHYVQKGLKFKEGYGLTEAGPNNFYISPEDAQTHIGSVGKPMMFNQVRIVDPNNGDQPPGEVGELLLYGDHTFEYYWNNPEETRLSFQNEWLHTGDLARQDEDGFIYIVGRKKEMIISGGENIYPLEIEHWLLSQPNVNEAAIVGIPDDKWGERVVAYISLKDSTNCIEPLKEGCRENFAGYKVPKQFHVLDELPKTDVGKIDKQSLVKQFSITD
ncbi:acyl-CoA synthetase [Halobacillus hunanensis]|uniref:acyl-CoA synthetase n=1 Tax=Halobacillus hunanensis TaxID=578214 RepID=UPI001FE2C8A5|nr:long-chain fatty acid--CoA ligase [Halobacillus hunanensis]